MVPSTTGRPQMKVRPPNTDCSVTGSRTGTRRSMRIMTEAKAANRNEAHATMNGTGAPTA